MGWRPVGVFFMHFVVTHNDQVVFASNKYVFCPKFGATFVAVAMEV